MLCHLLCWTIDRAIVCYAMVYLCYAYRMLLYCTVFTTVLCHAMYCAMYVASMPCFSHLPFAYTATAQPRERGWCVPTKTWCASTNHVLHPSARHIATYVTASCAPSPPWTCLALSFRLNRNSRERSNMYLRWVPKLQQEHALSRYAPPACPTPARPSPPNPFEMDINKVPLPPVSPF